VLVLVAITAWAVRVRREAPWVAVGWCWYLGMLVPVIGVVQVGSQALADRYMYVPLVGILIAVVWEAERLGRRLSRAAASLPLVAAAVVAVLSIVTARQVAIWRDSETLFRHTAAVTEENVIAHHLLSVELARQGRYVEALHHAREAVRFSPIDFHAQKNLGFVLFQLGLVDDGIAALRRAIELKPDFGEAHENLAIAYGRKGWTEEAMREMALGMKLTAAERAERGRR
jgi:tetratricopeptide (TPR) repeat protein